MVDQLNAEIILRQISAYVNDEVTYIDALVQYADDHGIEIEVVAEIVRRSPTLKGKIQHDAEQLKLVQRTSKLPL